MSPLPEISEDSEKSRTRLTMRDFGKDTVNTSNRHVTRQTQQQFLMLPTSPQHNSAQKTQSVLKLNMS